MSIVPGNNVTITSTQIVGSTSNLIVRTPTANSNDTLDTATNIIFSFYGINDSTYDGDSFAIEIYNNSAFTITLNPGTGITMSPTSTDLILPQTVRNYTLIKTSGTTLDLYLNSSGTAYNETGISLTSGNIFVGNASNIAASVSMSNDATISNTGALTLATVNSNVGSFSAANITVNAKGLITAAANGSAGAGGANTQVQFNNLGALDGSANLTWNGSTLSSTQFTSTVATGTAPLVVASTTTVANLTSTNSVNVGITDDTTTNATMYPTWVTTSSGNNPEKVSSTKLSFVPSSGVLSATSFSGAWSNAAALTKTDDTNVTLTLGGTPATALLQATSITAGWTGQLSLTRGGTNALLTASNGGIFYSTATAGAILSGTATAGQIIRSGVSSAPSWSTATYPATTTVNRLLYSSATNTITDLATANNGVLITSAGGVPSISSTLPTTVQGNITSLGTITSGTWNGGIIGPTYGGTGINNGSNTLTLGGNLTTSGAFASTFTMTALTAVTFPTTGTLATTSQLPTPAALTKTDDTNVTLTLGGTPATALLQATSITAGWTGQLSLTRGGTNASLTASNGGIFYSTATAGAILSGTATARQMLQSGASTTPAWSTTTWPATTTVNRLLYSSATNTIGEVTTANSAVLVTSSTGVPTYSSTMTNGQIIIGSTGATPVAASLTAGSGINITTGAGTITITNNVPLFRAYGPSATITPGAFPVAYTTLTTYNAPTFDSGTYSYSAGVVTILAAGTYEVCYTIQINSNGNTGSATGAFQAQIIQNGSSVAGSITESNMQRIAGTNNRTFNTKSWILTAALNDTLAIQYAETTTNTVFQLTQNESTFTIKRLQ